MEAWVDVLFGCASSHNQKDNNLKTKNNQNCQKIELHGSLTTKEIKKKHSSRLVRGAETGSRGGEDSQQHGGWRTQRGGGLWNGHARLQLADSTRWWLADPAAPHSCIDKLGGMAGKQSRLRNPGLQHGEMKPQTSD